MCQRKSRRFRSGVTAAEFARGLPLLFLFLLGMWGFGHLIHMRHTLMAAACETGTQASAGVPAADAAGVTSDDLSNSSLPTTNVSAVIDKEVERKKLGDHVESLLASIGVTKDAMPR